ncbi:exodeoxyribonuclease VII small subunit [Halorubrum ezzemoulense]|uniref:exodeoxyribonuclease VII small subunit n=1 Tax=Halorubrum ezzemoulense TaxID=337243 RepID=UPI00232EA369|nr:exodeoxyribonuclease VII small subunit [Halorubrum ezzemoulense]MDB2272536.1 exodeoxyribonuclease VII small subunit [Halorubrum ezzemoulense]
MSEAEVDIAETIDRLEEIAETLEDGEVDLTTAKELREEADDHLETLRDALDVGDGELIEIDGGDAELERAE